MLYRNEATVFTLGSLFSGIGGIDLAFSWAGFNVRWQVEIEPFCQAVLRKHSAQYWPNAELHNDVTKVTKAELCTVDVMAGGFPCQDVSQAGRRKGITEDTRSGLWFQFARLISELRPRIVLLENVPGILTKDGVRVIADLASMGYDAQWGVVPASAVGSPHERKRWFCVAYPMPQRWGSPGDGQEYSDDLDRIDSSHQLSGRAIESRSSSHSASLGNPDSEWQSQSQGSERRFGGWSEHPSQAMGNAIGERETAYQFAGQSYVALQASEDVVNTKGVRPQEIGIEGRNQETLTIFTSAGDRNIESILGRAAHGLSRRMDIDRWPARPGKPQHEWEAPRMLQSRIRDRGNRLKALGNAVVPQVVYPLAVAIREYLEITQR